MGWDQTRAGSKASALPLRHLHPHRRRATKITATGFICIEAQGCYRPGPRPSANQRSSDSVRNQIHNSPLPEEGARYHSTRKPNHRRQRLNGEGFGVLAAKPLQTQPRALNLLVLISKQNCQRGLPARQPSSHHGRGSIAQRSPLRPAAQRTRHLR